MSSRQNVCRLCLKNVPSDNYTPLDATFTEKFQLLDLVLIPSVNPIVCNTCKDSLEESYKLKRTCLSSNKLIKFLKNSLGIEQAVELKELIKSSNQKEDDCPKNGSVCRICLKSSEGDYKGIEVAKTEGFGSTLDSYLSTLDENLTTNPLICKICIDTLHKVCTFVKQFTDVENRVKCYSDKFPAAEVDLIKVLDDMDDQITLNEEIENRKRRSSVNPEESAKKQKMDVDPIDEEELPLAALNVTTGDELPLFDFSMGAVLAPYRRKIGMKDWIKQVEAVKTKLKWSDFTAKYKVLEKMKRLPQVHSWFSSVADIITWEEFKKKLVHAFPEENDYYFNVVRMVERKKRTMETYIEYFNAKLAVLEPLKLSEEEIVSCLLGGVSDVTVSCMGRIGNYANRDELLKYFKSWDDKHTINPKKRRKRIRNRSKQKEDMEDIPSEPKKKLVVMLEKQPLEKYISAGIDDTSGVTCPCCDAKGHSGPNCPLISNKKAVEENISISDGNEQNSTQKEVAGKSSDTQKCACCDKTGHSSMDCPLIKAKTAEKLTAGKGNDTAESTEKSSKKCACCDKLGHSSTDCPLIRGKVTEKLPGNSKNVLVSDKSLSKIAQDTTKIVKPASETVKEQSSVQKANDTTKGTEKSSSEQNLSLKCACCDKSGHSSMDCPLIKGKVTEKPAGNSNRGREFENTNESLSKIAQNTTKIVKPVSEAVKEQSSVQNANDTTKGTEKSSSEQNISLKCACCDKSGHSSMDCPLIKGKATEKPVGNSNRRREVENTNESLSKIAQNTSKIVKPVSEAVKEQSTVQNANDTTKGTEKLSSEQNLSLKCACCDKLGHSSMDCPLIKGKTTEKPAGNSNRGREVENTNGSLSKIAQNMSKSVVKPAFETVKEQSSVQKANDTTKGTEKSSSEQNLSLKCACCDKSGHSSMDCPLIKGKTTEKPAENSNKGREVENANESLSKIAQNMSKSVVKPASETVKEQSSVQKANDTTKGTEKSSSEQNLSLKCACCDKSGHSSMDCPLIKGKETEKPAGSSNRGRQIENRNESLSKTTQNTTKIVKPVSETVEKQSSVQKANDTTKRTEKSSSEQNSSLKCACCDKSGHSSMDCPLIKGKATEQPAGNSNRGRRFEKTNESSSKIVQNSTKIVKPVSEKGEKQSSVQKANDTTKRTEKSSNEQNLSLKCACCDKSGHSTMDCPLVTGKRSENSKNVVVHENVLISPTVVRRTQSCSCCNVPGHSSKDCPLIRRKTTQKPDTNSNRGRQVESGKEPKSSGDGQSQKKCSFCDNVGHSSLVCPLIDCEKVAPRRSNIRIILDKDRKNPRPDRSSVSSARKDLIRETDKEQSTRNQKKCSSCNKFGHTNLDCPLIVSKKPAGQKPAANDRPKCSNCNKVGHSFVDCLLIKVSKNQKSDKLKQTSSQVQTTLKCSSCNEWGHSRDNCDSMGVDEDELIQNNTRKCLCCNRIGHSSLDCPNLNQNRQNADNIQRYQAFNVAQPENNNLNLTQNRQNVDKIERYQAFNVTQPDNNYPNFSQNRQNADNIQRYQPFNVAQPEIKCLCCNKPGHTTENCTFYSFFNRNNSTPADGAVRGQPEHTAYEMNEVTDQKCCFCNQYGHSSIECFKTMFERKHSQPKNKWSVPQVPQVQNQVYQNQPKCDFCHRIGHSVSDCFHANFNKKTNEALYNSNVSLSRQCLNCGKFGHIPSDCPKNKRASRWSDFWKGQPEPRRF